MISIQPRLRGALVLLFCLLCVVADATYGQNGFMDLPGDGSDLQDPLRSQNGRVVRTTSAWTRRRRPEIIGLFEEYVYGVMPKRIPNRLAPTYQVVKDKKVAITPFPLDERETITVRMKEVTISFPDGPVLNLLILLPAEKPTPVFLGYNHRGNHRLHPTKEISLNRIWLEGRRFGLPEEDTRGRNTARWQARSLLAAGYGLVTLYFGEVAPNFDDGYQNGVQTMFPKLKERPDGWGSIAAWAWGCIA